MYHVNTTNTINILELITTNTGSITHSPFPCDLPKKLMDKIFKYEKPAKNIEVVIVEMASCVSNTVSSMS